MLFSIFADEFIIYYYRCDCLFESFGNPAAYFFINRKKAAQQS